MKKSTKTIATMLILALVVVCMAPMVSAKTTYVTKKELIKDRKEAIAALNKWGTAAGTENIYIRDLCTQALKLVPDITQSCDDVVEVGASGKITPNWKNMTPDLDCKEFKGVKWKSSNPKVLKVTSSGKVTALKKGKATITATSISSGKSSKVKITVIDEIDW
jgi:hypothetical protein